MTLESNIDANALKLSNALTIVDKRIETLIAGLADDSSGRLLSDSISLTQATNIRKDIAKEMLNYNLVAAEVSGSVNEAAKIAKAAFADIGDVSFAESDALMIQAMVDSNTAAMIAAGDAATSSITTAALTAVASGGDKAALMLMTQQLLIGGTAKNGKPLLNWANTINETAYMESHSAATIMLAEQAGVDRFRYSGSLIATSRRWCQTHVGKVYTYEEVKAWANSSWAGKKSGDPFIVRAGWNCRHFWVPVAPKP